MARIVTVTVSDAHQGDKDASGPAVARALRAAGHEVARHETAPNDRDAIERVVRGAVPECDVVFLTGGTGLGPKDVSVEVVDAIVEKRLEGFGEAFRRASEAEIGAKAMLSRATAGVLGGCLVFVVPGSPKGAALGAGLAAPVLDHASDVARGRAKRH